MLETMMSIADNHPDAETAYLGLMGAAALQPEFGAPPPIVLGTLGRAVLLAPERPEAWDAAARYLRSIGQADRAERIERR